ncbi:sulfotransferase [Streptomyces sp. Rer75]|uniref:sulfotransferase family protein n=1 Tax=Streptomyces sp. Rer75 TaxID=2750011 RepID=UPI0015CF8821|nr:sulfotransferase [Streptomyces sp. Rer75]QLH23178.1 sulfotransferase [Streptomyces sp. Rer75]
MAARPLTFVVGTGRCGSTALSEVLRLHPHLLSLSELMASLEPSALPEGPLTGEEFWEILASPPAFANRLIREGFGLPEHTYPGFGGRFSADGDGIPAVAMTTLPHLSDEPDALFDALRPVVCGRPRGPAGEHHRALFDALAERFGSRAVVERSGFSLRLVPRLREVFPEARFVHLYRDGADCALSMSRHPGFRMIQLMREGGDVPGELAALMSDESAEIKPLLTRPVPLSAFGRLWSDTVIEGLAHLDALPGELVLPLSYEALLDAPDAELTRLAAYLGVEPLSGWLAGARVLLDGGRRGSAERLPPAELAALRESCAAGVRALGV